MIENQIESTENLLCVKQRKLMFFNIFMKHSLNYLNAYYTLTKQNDKKSMMCMFSQKFILNYFEIKRNPDLLKNRGFILKCKNIRLVFIFYKNSYSYSSDFENIPIFEKAFVEI